MLHERLIKKYANRRLYDATASRHVTLEDIRKLIVDGEQIKVVDDKSGDDITPTVLLQIVVEQEQFGKPILSSQVLHSIVRLYGGAMEEFTREYLEKSIENLLTQQKAVHQQIAKVVSATPVVDFSDLARANLERWTEFQEQVFASLTATKKSSSKE